MVISRWHCLQIGKFSSFLTLDGCGFTDSPYPPGAIHRGLFWFVCLVSDIIGKIFNMPFDMLLLLAAGRYRSPSRARLFEVKAPAPKPIDDVFRMRRETALHCSTCLATELASTRPRCLRTRPLAFSNDRTAGE